MDHTRQWDHLSSQIAWPLNIEKPSNRGAYLNFEK